MNKSTLELLTLDHKLCRCGCFFPDAVVDLALELARVVLRCAVDGEHGDSTVRVRRHCTAHVVASAFPRYHVTRYRIRINLAHEGRIGALLDDDIVKFRDCSSI